MSLIKSPKIKFRTSGKSRLLQRYASRARDKKTVASIAVFNSSGHLLFGLRNDSKKWTLPGGHAEEGEDPRDTAIRELWEEAGLKADSVEYIGDGYGGRNNNIHVFAYKTVIDGEPTSENDPDGECSVWSWIDVSNGIPEIIWKNLHNKKNVTLKHLELTKKEAAVNIVDEAIDLPGTELSQSSRAPAGEEMQDVSVMHPLDTQKNAEVEEIEKEAGGFGLSLNDLTTPSIGTSDRNYHNLGENTQEDPDLKLGCRVSMRQAYLYKLAANEGFLPAFKNKMTNEIIVSPGFHNLQLIPGAFDDDDIFMKWEDGFATPNGQFLTRAQAKERLNFYTSEELRDTQSGIEPQTDDKYQMDRPVYEMGTNKVLHDEIDPALAAMFGDLMKESTVEAPYTDGIGAISPNIDDDKKYNITRGAGILLDPEVDRALQNARFKVLNVSKSNGAVLLDMKHLPTGANVSGFRDDFGWNFNYESPGGIPLGTDGTDDPSTSAGAKLIMTISSRLPRLLEHLKMKPMPVESVALPDNGMDENKYGSDYGRLDQSIPRNTFMARMSDIIDG